MALIFVVFYFFLIRPQQQKAKQHEAMLDALRRGDRVVTAGGIIGTVAKVDERPGSAGRDRRDVRVRVVRSTITRCWPSPSRSPPRRQRTRHADKKDDKTPELGGAPMRAAAGTSARAGSALLGG